MRNEIGEKILNFGKELWSFNRSLSGKGVRDTLKKIKEELPKLKIKKVLSSTKAFDWIVPDEWIINDAYIITPSGKKICHFKKNNLYLVGYSCPINSTLSLKELQKHLYSLPSQSNAIPFVASYYKKQWGFCIEHTLRKKLKEGLYKVVIDSKLINGELNYGEIFLKGKSKQEIFLSTYICHPSMANDNISGIALSTYLAKWLSSTKRKRSEQERPSD